MYINEKHTSGIFLSPTRGLVEYDARQDGFSEVSRNDSRIADRNLFAAPPVHTIFGDAYLILRFLKKCGMVSVLRESFNSDRDYEKVLCHLLHTICRNGSKISCDDLISRFFASCILDDVQAGSLGSNTLYFTMIEDGKVKMAFFQAAVSHMKDTFPGFRNC